MHPFTDVSGHSDTLAPVLAHPNTTLVDVNARDIRGEAVAQQIAYWNQGPVYIQNLGLGTT